MPLGVGALKFFGPVTVIRTLPMSAVSGTLLGGVPLDGSYTWKTALKVVGGGENAPRRAAVESAITSGKAMTAIFRAV